jgi:hypothetical protein
MQYLDMNKNCLYSLLLFSPLLRWYHRRNKLDQAFLRWFYLYPNLSYFSLILSSFLCSRHSLHMKVWKLRGEGRWSQKWRHRKGLGLFLIVIFTVVMFCSILSDLWLVQNSPPAWACPIRWEEYRSWGWTCNPFLLKSPPPLVPVARTR